MMEERLASAAPHNQREHGERKYPQVSNGLTDVGDSPPVFLGGLDRSSGTEGHRDILGFGSYLDA